MIEVKIKPIQDSQAVLVILSNNGVDLMSVGPTCRETAEWLSTRISIELLEQAISENKADSVKLGKYPFLGARSIAN